MVGERRGELVAQSCLLFPIPWNVAHQAPLSMGFSRQEQWSGWPFPSPGALSDPGIKPGSPASQADSLLSEPMGQVRGRWTGNVTVWKLRILSEVVSQSS